MAGEYYKSFAKILAAISPTLGILRIEIKFYSQFREVRIGTS